MHLSFFNSFSAEAKETCRCYSPGMLQGSEFTVYETLAQYGEGAPQLKSSIPSFPSTYRPPSNVSGQTWSFTLDGRDIRVDFHQGSYVRFSDPALGADGRWKNIGRNVIKIETPSRTIMGTFTNDGEGMTATVYRPGSSIAEISGLIFRRIR